MNINENINIKYLYGILWKVLKNGNFLSCLFLLPFLLLFQCMVYSLACLVEKVLLTTGICTAMWISTNSSFYPYDNSRWVLSFSFINEDTETPSHLCWLCNNHHHEQDYMLSPVNPLSKSLSLGVGFGDLPNTETELDANLQNFLLQIHCAILESSRIQVSKLQALDSGTILWGTRSWMNSSLPLTPSSQGFLPLLLPWL